MSDSKIPVPETILEFARHRATFDLSNYGHPKDELKEYRDRALAAISQYRKAKELFEEHEKNKKEIADWLASVQPA